jgi:hypothetical protein
VDALVSFIVDGFALLAFITSAFKAFIALGFLSESKIGSRSAAGSASNPAQGSGQALGR